MATTLVDSLYELQNQGNNPNYPKLSHLLPTDAQIFDVNLNERLVDIPQFLSVQYDHNAEVLYLRCPRYYDNMDLVNTTCVIQYINANGDAGIYWVPFYDIYHYNEEEGDVPTILLPWAIGGLATLKEGLVTFCLRFYVIEEYAEDGETKKRYAYNMQTVPQQGRVLHGMDISNEDLSEYIKDMNIVDQIYNDMRIMRDEATFYWIDV